MTDGQVFLRWESKENVICPKCGVHHHTYFISTHKQWRCKHCKHTFSITSGTIFANHKLPLKTYLLAIALFTNAVKRKSSLHLSHDLGVQYKTASVLAQKLRKALLVHRELTMMSGEVDMDGTYVHLAPRKANKKADRIDYPLKENQNSDKRCIIVARKHYTEAEKQANRYARGAKIYSGLCALCGNAIYD
ncbi:transposase [Pasteurella multocida 671/90]|nr:transposase [Pasteurella multocida 671/90]